MTGLRLTDSGWYFCSTGDLQVPVQLTVTKTNPVRWENLQTSDSGYYWCAVEICGYNTQDDRYYLYLTVQSVRWENLQTSDSGYYWCAVEIGGYNTPDDGYYLYLKVQSGDLQVPVQLTVTKPKQAPTTIPAATPSDFEIDMPFVILAVCLLVMLVLLLTVALVAIVTWRLRKKQMQWKNLQTSDSGYYWCAVEIGGPDDGYYLYLTVQSGDLQVPVQLTVTKPKQAPTTIPATKPSGSKTDMRDVILAVCLLVMLVLLLLVTLVAIVTWRLRKKQKRSQNREEHLNSTRNAMPCENQMTSNSPADATFSASVDEGSVIYSSVITFHKAVYYSKPENPVIYSTINDENPNDPSKDITTYSTIDYVPGSEADMNQYQNIFTVQWENLQTSDSGYYWCAVEIGGYNTPDDGYYLYLKVQSGDWQAPVQLTVTKPKQAPTTIPATKPSGSKTDMHTTQSSANIKTTTMNKIMNKGGQIREEEHLNSTRNAMPCEIQMTSNSPADATSSSSVDELSVIYSSVIHKAPSSSVNSECEVIYSAVKKTPKASLFTVTMRNLQNNQTGHYYCGERNQGESAVTYKLNLKVQSVPDVSVVNSSVSGHEGGDISVQCLYSSEYQKTLKRWCKYKDKKCYAVEQDQHQVRERNSSTTDTVYYSKPEDPVIYSTINDENPNDPSKNITTYSTIDHVPGSEAIYSKPDDPVIYSTINDENPNDPNKDITYSTIDHVTGSKAVKPPADGAIYSIIYSTVAPHRQQQ
ncbi:polymeric immunoglobulin receptor-like protein [Labeo rohita]|nr:polymeric immunoglobulin receptor-like protein [Labeo rohita]